MDIILFIKHFSNQLKKDNVSAFSAQAAFFLILSIVPFLSLLLTMIQFLPISKSLFIKSSLDIFPPAFDPMVKEVIEELYDNNSGAVISISAITALWSAGRGVLAIIRGLNSVYHVEEKRNYFVLRIVSAVYALLFILAIGVMLLLIVFGNTIFSFTKTKIPLIGDIIGIFINHKLLLTAGLLFIFFLFVFKLVKKENMKFSYVLPSSILCAISWIIFSYAFSIYVEKISNFSYTYGSLSTIAILMLWVYFCMYILFIGGEVNICVRYIRENNECLISNKIKSKDINQ